MLSEQGDALRSMSVHLNFPFPASPVFSCHGKGLRFVSLCVWTWLLGGLTARDCSFNNKGSQLLWVLPTLWHQSSISKQTVWKIISLLHVGNSSTSLLDNGKFSVHQPAITWLNRIVYSIQRVFVGLVGSPAIAWEGAPFRQPCWPSCGLTEDTQLPITQGQRWWGS